MKFKKLSLGESLFDDSLTDMPVGFVPSSNELTSYDDEFVDSDLPDSSMEGPKQGSDSGVTDLIITAINDEWEAIRAYNSVIQTLKYEASNNPDYESFVAILNEINSEENKHVGQLQEILQKLSPNARYIDKGREEGRSQFNFVNGQLQVQSWQQAPTNGNTQTNGIGGDDMCSIIDVDDEM